MTGYYYHTVADGVNSLYLSANKGGKVSLITKCVASWNRKRKSGTSCSDKPRLLSYVKPNEFQKTALLKKMLDLRDDLFGPISMVGGRNSVRKCVAEFWRQVNKSDLILRM